MEEEVRTSEMTAFHTSMGESIQLLSDAYNIAP